MPAAGTDALTDAGLLQRAATGDGTAFTTLVTRHQDAVYRFITTLGARDADAEDALQECFLAAWRGAGGYTGAGSARSWLLSIARNAVRRQRRRHVGEPATHVPLDELALRAGWAEPEAPMLDEDAEEAQEIVRRALARLEAPEREILLLRDVEGLPGDETARALGLTIAAMKSRLHRARLHLAAAVREESDAQS